MGFNSLIFINNDCMGQIDADPGGWWQIAKRALGSIAGAGSAKTFAFHGYANHNIAVWCRPQESVGLIGIGHNDCRRISSIYDVADDIDHTSDDGKLKLLQAAANEIGYKLVKIPRKRAPICEDTSSPGPRPKPTRQKSSSTKTPSKIKKKPSKKASKTGK